MVLADEVMLLVKHVYSMSRPVTMVNSLKITILTLVCIVMNVMESVFVNLTNVKYVAVLVQIINVGMVSWFVMKWIVFQQYLPEP